MIKILPVLGVFIGFGIGLLFPMYIPKEYTLYLGVGIIAAIDSVFGAVKAILMKKFNLKIFFTGFLFNALIAVAIIYIGRLLGLDVYIAFVIVFIYRIFSNIAQIRRILLKMDLKSDIIN